MAATSDRIVEAVRNRLSETTGRSSVAASPKQVILQTADKMARTGHDTSRGVRHNAGAVDGHGAQLACVSGVRTRMHMTKLTLMAVLAHPDDESLGFGGTLATYAAQGVEVVLVTATRGDAGRYRGKRPGEDGHPGQAALAAMRERELKAAAATLGIRHVAVLDYKDQHLSQADARQAAADIARHIRTHRPQVVVTFGMDGAYGHPDHIAVSQLTTASIVAAAAPDSAGRHAGASHDAHVVSKCYHLAWPASTWSAYQRVFGELTSTVDGLVRRASPAPEWSLSAVVDATAALPIVLRAAHCHESQVGTRERLHQVSSEELAAMWSQQSFSRVFSLVDVGTARESDLFAGIR